MTLYEIKEEMQNCIDYETGEFDEEKYNALQMDAEKKIEGAVLIYKNNKALVEGMKAEIDAIKKRMDVRLHEMESLTRYINDALDGSKFETAKCSVSWRKSEQVIVDNEELVPADYKKEEVTIKVDKTALKKAIKEGTEVDGCHLEEKQNIQIK